MANTRIIRIIGHKRPDTDSICSAISYAFLKNQISDRKHEARRAGEINAETAFVLEHFGVELPRLSVDMSPSILNIDIREEPGINGEMSVRSAWKRMQERDVDTLCIIGQNGTLSGVLSVNDLARANMDILDRTVLADAKTSYSNLLKTIDGKMLAGHPASCIFQGKILVAVTADDLRKVISEGDIILATRSPEVQRCAIMNGASCLILCMGAEISDELLQLAKEKNCTVIRTEYDTYAASRLVSLSAPVRHYMTTEGLITFHIDTPIEEARKIMAERRLHYYPILDTNEAYIGMISRRNLLNVHQKEVILVDHNETSQAVDGLEGAKILEIIDHHRIGALETGSPVYFRNEPVGCTATIVYSMFGEHGVAIPKRIAGLLLSAILSDTLMFNSPTCTLVDKAAAKDLAIIAGEEIEAYGWKMFEAGEDLSGRSAEDLLYADYKEFAIGSSNIAVGQGFFVSEGAFGRARELMEGLFPGVVSGSGKQLVLYMLTHVPTQTTLLFYAGKDADEIIQDAFGRNIFDAAFAQNVSDRKDSETDLPKIFAETDGVSIILPGIVSRKQQLIPPLRERLLR